VARKLVFWLWLLAPSAALGVAVMGLIGYLLDRPSQGGVSVPEPVCELGDRPAGPEFQVTIAVRNDGNRRCRVIGVGGEC
jgi:hypothetical protein